MPCTEHHYVPVLDEIAARDPDYKPPGPPSAARIAGRGWGGRRPGAGAPRGNMNGFRHGRYSVRHRRLIQILAQIPEAREALIDIGIRQRKQQRLAQAGASALLAEVLQRAGDMVLNPQPNHVEPNQACPEERRDWLDFLRSLQAQIEKISKMQSREARRLDASIKKPDRRQPARPATRA
jgi:hypothetical protein